MSAKAKTELESDYDEIMRAIAGSSLADGLDDQALTLIARLGVLRRYEAGDTIVRQDEVGEHLLVLAKGRAEITTYLDEPLYYLRPGMLFGEVALIDEKPRSATVRAQEDSEVVLLPADSLRALIFGTPAVGVIVLRNVANVLCSRLRAANQQIAALLTIEELHETGI
jgi:CRP/FNR family transcriptional regulator, cyclic AMP receptor protein